MTSTFATAQAIARACKSAFAGVRALVATTSMRAAVLPPRSPGPGRP
ncbi:MAG: hypothetical protein M3N82_05655 [Pseudomonadota bacterium]|nr:hypothetical protein [Pseudomonadota bacterium]